MSTSVTGPRASKITAWHAPDEPWYPIAAMKWSGQPVVVALFGGGAVLAEIRRHPRRRQMWWWVQLGTWAGEGYGWTREEVLLEKVWHEPVSDHSPIAFRPADGAAWRHPLPDPLPSAFGGNRPDVHSASAPDFDPHHGSDDWPYPGVRLGCLTVPASREECEARLLRAFRTEASHAGGRIGAGASSFSADIPSEMSKIALKTAEAERLRDERRAGVVGNAEAVRSGWTPTRRDLTDWVYALGWLNHAEPRAVRVVSLRAADPPFSFRQIGEMLRSNHETSRLLYGRAVDHAFASARSADTAAGSRQ